LGGEEGAEMGAVAFFLELLPQSGIEVDAILQFAVGGLWGIAGKIAQGEFGAPVGTNGTFFHNAWILGV